MFDREHHQSLAAVLKRLDGDRLLQHHCLLGGGAPIVLPRGEYRDVRRIELCCHSREAYRAIHLSVASQNIGWLFREPTMVVRQPNFNRHGIRLTAVMEGVSVQIQIIQESRVPISAPLPGGRLAGVWTLTDEDMVATKLMANADRYADDSFMSRDIIDLAMMATDGVLLPAGVAKARSVYQQGIDTACARARHMLLEDDERLARCMSELKMSMPLRELRTRIESLHFTGTVRSEPSPLAQEVAGSDAQANRGARVALTRSRSASPTAGA